jgi:hypothetical protein
VALKTLRSSDDGNVALTTTYDVFDAWACR